MLFWKKASSAAEGAVHEAGAMQVLLVCTGNICRSPMAEGVLRAKLGPAGLARRVRVDSAGTHGYHTAEPPDPRAIRQASRRGYDIAALRARPVLADDFARFHWMLAMDEGNLAWLERHVAPGGGPRIELMARQSPHLVEAGILEVPDPYYGPDAGFEQVLNLLEQACDGFVARLLREGSPAR